MKLATYQYKGKQSFGVVTDGGICDIPAVWGDGPRSVVEALQGGAETMKKIASLAAKAKTLLAEKDVTLLAPLPAPTKILALAGNYVKHIQESRLGKGLTERPHETTVPRPFLMPNTCVAAPGATVPWPCYSKEIDYEIELAIVIGKTAKCVSAQQAKDCIAGYTIVNDVSARSVTFKEARAARPWDEFFDWLNGKWADGFCPMGPYLVTADEVGDPHALAMQLTVNGKTRQDSSTGAMIFDVYEIVSFLSHIMTLTPGDVIATGTPHGVGMATGEFLHGGDVITCRIEKLGELTVKLGQEPKEYYTPCKQ